MSENKQSRVARFLVYSFLILLVMYVLSLGPAVALCIDSNGSINHDSLTFIQTFYSPLFAVIEKSAFLKDLMQRYVEFCYSYRFHF